MHSLRYLLILFATSLLLIGCQNEPEPFEGILTYVYYNEAETMDKPDTVIVYLKNGNSRIKEVVNDRLFITEKNNTYLINEENKKFFAYYIKDCYDSVFFSELNLKRKNLYIKSETNEQKTINNIKCKSIRFLDSLTVPEGTNIVPFWEYQIWINKSYGIIKHPVAEHSEIDEVEYVLEQGYLPVFIKKTYRGEAKYGKLIVTYELINIQNKKLDDKLFSVPEDYERVSDLFDLY